MAWFFCNIYSTIRFVKLFVDFLSFTSEILNPAQCIFKGNRCHFPFIPTIISMSFRVCDLSALRSKRNHPRAVFFLGIEKNVLHGLKKQSGCGILCANAQKKRQSWRDRRKNVKSVPESRGTAFGGMITASRWRYRSMSWRLCVSAIWRNALRKRQPER